ncbi:MAG: UDP-3-O-(3-hydroxymyristoyl)glucosamine N-acyltransferase, partial [Candidatus Marinimicrobia bacterium]|nr:UDP-3-O-(3-hydroxymyristoyl)glucosamine N-acyltransferase [Candidatus Neomarinimicrobiota bacterium]
MPAQIHPTAIIDPQADLGREVQVGPFAVIEGGTKIGDHT